MDNNRVRICDIAEELGLSTATVSNVIHGKTNKMSEETVKRVQELLEKRQYIPNMAGILLAQNDSKIFGVVIHNHPKYEGHILEDGFISASLNALYKEAEEAGCFLMIKITEAPEEIAKFASMWNMAGLVLIGFCEQDYQKLRDKIRVPFVIYDGLINGGKRLVNLVIDNFDGGKQTGEHLKKLGHQKALCLSDNDIHVDRDRFLGLKSVLPESELLIIPMEKKERDLFYEKKLSYIRAFTAVFAVSDYYAVDFMRFLSSHGLSIPNDISVCGFDNSALSSMVHPPLTTVGQDHSKRAKLAVELLKKLRANEKVNNEYSLPVKLIERWSTK